MFKKLVLAALTFGSVSANALDSVSNFNTWNWGIDFHGTQAQTGESLSFSSPHISLFQFRLGLSTDGQSTKSNDSDISFAAAHFSVLLFQRTKEDSPIRPYLGIGYDMFFSGNATTPGTFGGYSIFPGIQIWQPIEIGGTKVRNVAFFIEGGPSTSNFYSDTTTGNQHLNNAFVMKLGFLNDF